MVGPSLVCLASAAPLTGPRWGVLRGIEAYLKAYHSCAGTEDDTFLLLLVLVVESVRLVVAAA